MWNSPAQQQRQRVTSENRNSCVSIAGRSTASRSKKTRKKNGRKTKIFQKQNFCYTTRPTRERRISVAYVSQIRLQSSVFCEKILQPETRRRTRKRRMAQEMIFGYFFAAMLLSLGEAICCRALEWMWMWSKHLTSTHIIFLLLSLFCETLNGTAFRKVKLTHSRFLQID